MTHHTRFTDSSPADWFHAGLDYLLDRWQRSFLVADIMRQRGNNYLTHLRAGQPPVLVFDYEPVLDGQDLDPPVNYTLLKISNRRTGDTDRRSTPRGTAVRRQSLIGDRRPQAATAHRPLVVIDPRAGHGPGIGGSKLDSQIGVALDCGYPVYFMTFSTEPAPGQTIAAVQEAEIRFLEEVARRHPGAPKPAVIGNCQAGWAAALIGADRPDVVGPMVLNGSPLSYWGGVEGANPMRYKGGLSGGMWMATLWSDLGNGVFDGAHLVAGFEDLNPANTYWTKYYHLFCHVDSEARRFLNFEKWWGGFFKLGAEEIRFITRSLFVGNELEKGSLELQAGRPINLKRFKEPIFVFASRGDNITTPPQALNWIYKVYGSVKEIKRQGQTIIYMVHENIGHLGIFVSGKVAAKEHREIIGCLEMVEYLVPGLYEMVITNNAANPEIGNYTVAFEAREMADILSLDDGLEDEDAFVPVAAISEANDTLYRTWVRPYVRALTTHWSAEMLRQLHPLRLQRYGWSDLNPWLWPLAAWAPLVNQNRRPVSADNPFVTMETGFADMLVATLNLYRDLWGGIQELLFKSIYTNPWLSFWWGQKAPQAVETLTEGENHKLRRHELAYAHQNAGRGGFAEAVMRIIIAVSGVGRAMDRRQADAAEGIIAAHAPLQRLSPEALKALIRNQARILSADAELALKSLARLLPTQAEREVAFDIAMKIALADARVDSGERRLLTRIRRVLELHHKDPPYCVSA